MCFEEPMPGCDLYHKRHVRADESGHCACARMRGLPLAEPGPGRIWVRHTGLLAAVRCRPIRCHSTTDRQRLFRAGNVTFVFKRREQQFACARQKIILAFRFTSTTAHAKVSLFATSVERFSADATIFCQFAAENNAGRADITCSSPL